MRTFLLTFIFLTSLQASAADKESPLIQKRQVAQFNDVCKEKVMSLIQSTARSMGVTKKIGLQLISEVSEENDSLLNLSSGVFKVEEGYLSHSGASLVVRPQGKSCEILKMDISVGG